MYFSPATLQDGERRIATQTASAKVYCPIYSFLLKRSNRFDTSRTSASCISFNEGKMVMARPVARTCRSLPKTGRYLAKI